jgi:tetrahydromethanopterin S-methyltransferase subunit G
MLSRVIGALFAVVITGLFVLMIYRVITSWSRKDEDE